MYDTEKNLFERDGFVCIKNFLTEEEGEMIKKNIRFLHDAPEIPGKYMKYYETTENGRQLARIENFVNYNDVIRGLLDRKLTPLVDALVGEKMALFKDKANWKLPGGNGFKPHQDHPAWTDLPPEYFLTIAVFADNCTLDNGCLEIVRGRHREGVFENDYASGGGINEQVVAGMNWEHMITNVRDIIVFDGFVPHRSGKNKTNSSRSIYYFTYNKASEGDFYDEYFAKKREMLPPDIEKDHSKKYDVNNKYNLANPISYDD